MAANHITLDRTKSLADEMSRVINTSLELHHKATRLLERMNRITDGGATPANMQTHGVPVADCAAAYAIINDGVKQVVAPAVGGFNLTYLAQLDNG